jgi:hypothetical protein
VERKTGLGAISVPAAGREGPNYVALRVAILLDDEDQGHPWVVSYAVVDVLFMGRH